MFKLSGTAVIAACAACSDGHDVGYIGTSGGSAGALTINGVAVAKFGPYHILVAYENGGSRDRTATIAVNGAPGGTVNFLLGKDFNTVRIAPMNVQLQAGQNAITFANPTAYGPDISALGAPQLITRN